MSGVALTLVLASSVAHVSWNYLAKRTGGGAVFLWSICSLSLLIYAPLFAGVLLTREVRFGSAELLFIVGSGVLHVGYFLSLQKGYQVSDLSIVYPLARGGGPLLAALGGIVLLGERPTALAGIGIALVTTGALNLMRTEGDDPQAIRAGITFGLITALFISVYSVWDAYAMSELAIHPIVYDWSNTVVRLAIVSPLAFRNWGDVRVLWGTKRTVLVGVAILVPLAYILVLGAFAVAPVSYVAPTREVSIVLSAIIGARVLAEGDPRRRLISSGLILVGVGALALG